jgi:hypothetical protein
MKTLPEMFKLSSAKQERKRREDAEEAETAPLL